MACICNNTEHPPVEFGAPAPTRIGHYSVNFQAEADRHEAFNIVPLLNGEPVINAFECMGGPHGWVVRYVEDNGKRHYCDRHRDGQNPYGGCWEILYGDVAIKFS